MWETANTMADDNAPSNTRTLILFFTFGVSLETWQDVGMLEREVALYEELADYFDRIVLLTYGDETDKSFEEQLPDGVEVLPKRRISNDVLYSIFAPLIQRQTLRDADIVKTNQMLGSWTAVLTKYLYNVPLVVRTGYVLTEFYERKSRHPVLKAIAHVVEAIAYKASDAVLTSSRDGFEYVEETYRPPGIHQVHPNYIETDVFTPSDTDPDHDICFVGRLAPQKNLIALFEALVDLPHSLTVVGEGDQRTALEQYAEEHDVSVTFEGNVPNHELPALLTNHRAFILPSHYEGMPKSLLEAMSCGVSCIGTDVTGINEVLTDEETGLLCDTDANSIGDTIDRLLTDPALREKLGEAARNHIIDTYSLAEIKRAEIEVYVTLLEDY